MSKLLEKTISAGSAFVDDSELASLGKEAREHGYIVIVNSFFDGVASVQLWRESNN